MSLAFRKTSKSSKSLDYPPDCFRSSRFRSRTSQALQLGYDDDDDETSEEEIVELHRYAPRRPQTRLHVDSSFKIVTILFVLVFTIMVAHAMRHQIPIYAEFTRGKLRRTSRRIRNQLSFSKTYIQSISPSFGRSSDADPLTPLQGVDGGCNLVAVTLSGPNPIPSIPSEGTQFESKTSTRLQQDSLALFVPTPILSQLEPGSTSLQPHNLSTVTVAFIPSEVTQFEPRISTPLQRDSLALSVPTPILPQREPEMSGSTPLDPPNGVILDESTMKILDDRIDAAISRRSINSLPLRDFALNAEYIPDLTSYVGSTLDPQRQRGLRNMHWVSGFRVGRTLGHSPNAALAIEENDRESCWLFPGSTGHLGIRLPTRVLVESFTIENFPRDQLPTFDPLRAPRKVVLWGLVEGTDELSMSKARLYWEDSLRGGPLSQVFSQSKFMAHREGQFFVPLAAFEYKLAGGPLSHIQRKRTSYALQSLQLDFEIVVLEVLSNWGATSTCLYRVQIHGSHLNAVALTSP